MGSAAAWAFGEQWALGAGFGAVCDWPRTASLTGHWCSPLLLKPCHWCPTCRYSADFSNLVLKFYSAKKQCTERLQPAVLNFEEF